MRLITKVPDHEFIPAGYGVAWRDDLSDVRTAMPLGINYLAGLLRRAWWFVGCGYKVYQIADLKREVSILKARNARLVKQATWHEFDKTQLVMCLQKAQPGWSPPKLDATAFRQKVTCAEAWLAAYEATKAPEAS